MTLLNLNISNIVITKATNLEFEDGLNIISGETGSGKSILLDSLMLCLGEKNSNLKPFKDAAKGVISCQFDVAGKSQILQILQDEGVEAEDVLTIKRIVTDTGRSTASINDVAASSTILKRLSEHLLELYGQHDSSSLLENKTHINVIDKYAGIEEKVAALSKIYYELKENISRKNELEKALEKARKDEEYFKDSIAEIEKLNLQEGEEEEIVGKKASLNKLIKSAENIYKAKEILEHEVSISAISNVQKMLFKLDNSDGQVNPKIEEISNFLDAAAENIDKALSGFDDILSDVDNPDQSLEMLDDRLHEIRELARKHRVSSVEFAALKADYEAKLQNINHSGVALEEVKEIIKKLEAEYSENAKVISKIRKDNAKKLEKSINAELPELNMKGAEVRFDISDKNQSANGIDEIVIVARTNLGGEVADISKIASGGELSRIMLALKIALSVKLKSNSIIFDEIDTGLGGATAEAVGRKLQQLAKTTQVIAITHSPQVASKAAAHFKVEKFVEKNLTISKTVKLSEKESAEEIARMLSGQNITDEARSAAKSLKKA